MNPDNRWIQMADKIPWDQFEVSYVRRDIGYLEGYFSQGCVPDNRDIRVILANIEFPSFFIQI